MMSYSTEPSAPKYGTVVDAGQQEYGGLQFDEKSIRRGFIRKVFTVLTIQLLIVTAMIAAVVASEDTRLYVQQNNWIYWVSYGVFLVTYITLLCCEGPRRQFPLNMILLVVLTLAIGYMTAMISAMYSTNIVLWAIGICTLCCFSIIVFSCQTKYDFTGCMGVMYVIGMCVLMFGLLTIFVTLIAGETILNLIYAVVMAIVFMVYIAIDIQMIVGGRTYELHPEELSECEVEAEQHVNITEVDETRNSGRSWNNLPSGYMLCYSDDDNKAAAGTGLHIPASLMFI
uniref:Uncharacterized protein n=1 Tax=Plectus sambesii TaxID=2011161 RepID=A0A914WYK3_9BILA